jgi:hypothetical protein
MNILCYFERTASALNRYHKIDRKIVVSEGREKDSYFVRWRYCMTSFAAMQGRQGEISRSQPELLPHQAWNS